MVTRPLMVKTLDAPVLLIVGLLPGRVRVNVVPLVAPVTLICCPPPIMVCPVRTESEPPVLMVPAAPSNKTSAFVPASVKAVTGLAVFASIIVTVLTVLPPAVVAVAVSRLTGPAF